MSDLERVKAFLAAHNTMTLATTGLDSGPQAAAVFYAADDQLNLYFLSSPSSRHSQNLMRDARVAATVHSDGQAWQKIRGVQIEGSVQLVEDARILGEAVWTYAGRYDFLRGLLDDGGDGPPALRGPVASSRFYLLRPAWIRLIDNSQGFAHKEEWTFDSNG